MDVHKTKGSHADVRAILPLILLLLAAGCSDGKKPAHADLFHGPVGIAGPAGPIAEILTAESVGKDGRPVGPSADFPPSASQVTAVVSIGNLAGSTPEDLLVSWFQTKGSSDQPLFTQHIQVTPGAQAYSKGTSPGLLARGRYSVVASLEGVTARWTWVVAKTSTKTKGRLRRASLPTAPPSKPTVGPPVSGSSGSVRSAQGPNSSAAPSTGGCSVAVQTTTGTYATVDTTGCGKDSIVVTVSGEGGPSTTIDHITGDQLRFESVDPCKIGGSDLPGAKLTFVATVASGSNAGKSATATSALDQDEQAPIIRPDSTPSVGSQVFAGDHVAITLLVSDPPLFGVAGVAEIKVTSSQVAVNNGVQSFGTQPAPCDNVTRLLQPSFTVPADPPDLITLSVSAKDFAGNQRTLELNYPTKAQWDGVAALKATATVPMNNCRQNWLVSLMVFVAGKGAVSGTATASPLYPPRCAGGFLGAAAGEFDLKISGTFDGDKFRIRFDPKESPGGFEAGFHLLYYPGPPTIELPLKFAHGTNADVEIDLANSGPQELRGGGGSATLNGDMFLGCGTCK